MCHEPLAWLKQVEGIVHDACMHAYIHTYMHTYMCVCACVRVCVCACVHVYVYVCYLTSGVPTEFAVCAHFGFTTFLLGLYTFCSNIP